MPLSATAITESILALEQRLNLDDPVWTEDDVHWWPLYRTEIYRLLVVADTGTPVAGWPSLRLGPVLRPSTAHKRAPTDQPVWLVSDGLSYANTSDGLQIERFCGPLSMRCAAANVPAAIIDRASPAPRRTREPSRWWAPSTQRAKIIASLVAHIAPQAAHTRRVARVHDAAEALGLPNLRLNARRMQAMASATLRLADRLERRMRSERVRAVFVVSYYDVAGYAYVLAAARAGVTSVDIQHGVAGQYNMAYAQWPARQAPWRLLPRWFWTWTDADAAVIQAWAPRGSHTALCGGNPFLDAWRDGALALDAAMQEQLDGLRRRTGQRRSVLVTLQPYLVHAEALAPLLSAMSYSKNTFWWLRLHPMGLKDRPALEALLASHGIEAFDIDTATTLPLPALLTQASLHATHSSSTFLEAAALGVPTIVWSSYGADFAAQVIAEGNAHHVATGREFQACVEQELSAVTAQSQASHTQRMDALRTILESCPP